MNRLLLVTLILFGLNSTAQAGVYLEPYIGYNIGIIKYDAIVAATNVPSLSVSDALTGPSFGARVGWSLPAIWIAADYATGTLSSKLDGGTNNDFTLTRLGATVGFHWLPLVTPWVGYVLSSKLDQKSATNEYEGKGLKAGLGLTMFPFVSLNLEYLLIEYDDKTVGTLKYKNIKDNGLYFSVSLPLDL